MNYETKVFRVSMIIACLLLFSGCGSMFPRSIRSSLVDYLYPHQHDFIATEQIPHLQLPLRVGIAFTPGVQGRHAGFTEVEKESLARHVSEGFKQYDFVRSMEVIPSNYLRPQGSFANLDHTHWQS